MTWWLLHYAALPLVRGLRHVHHLFGYVLTLRGLRG